MSLKLIKVFDTEYNYENVIIPLSIDFDEVLYIYNHEIENNQLSSCSEVLHKYKENIKVSYHFIKDNEKDINNLLDENTVIDISTTKYLSSFLFEKALKNNLQVIYYDGEELSIKSYKEHKTIVDKVFSLNIEDMIKLGGGTILKNTMHESINLKNELTKKTIIDVVDNNINKYSAFINYVQRINTFISHRKIKNLSYKLSTDIKNKIIHDELYIKNNKYNLFKIEDNVLTFLNEDIEKLFLVSGSILENYLYIKLSDSNKFDQVLMSSIIDFSHYYNRYPIVCEIDLLAIKNNHLLFISCKSNKVDTDALNEIKIHNTIFGNELSEPVICTIDDLSSKSPAEYLKARELKIAVIDKTAFTKDNIVEELIKIINRTYKYERV